MSSKLVPLIAKPINPTGVDWVIQKLQAVLGGASYLHEDGVTQLRIFEDSVIFGKAEKYFSDKKFENGEPMILWRDKEFKSLTANDEYKSYCFFYEHDSREVSEDGTDFDLSLVCWFDKYKYDRVDYPIREWFISEVTRVLLPYVDSMEVFTERKNIFQDFDIKKKNPIFDHRFDGFRVRFTMVEYPPCGVRFLKK